MGDSPHPPRHRRDSLQPGCRDCSRYPCPRCLSCPSCCCRPCCCCPRCPCCCRLCWTRWSCHCRSRCCCLSKTLVPVTEAHASALAAVAHVASGGGYCPATSPKSTKNLFTFKPVSVQ